MSLVIAAVDVPYSVTDVDNMDMFNDSIRETPKGWQQGAARQPLKRAPQEQECDQECKPPYIGEIHFSNTVKCVSQLTGLICNIETSILLDTGSSLSLVNAKIGKESKMPISHMKSVYMKTACNDHVDLSSYLYLTIKISGLEKKH